MLRVGMQNNGFVLFVVLIFLFVLTIISISGSQHLILENKMQHNLNDHAKVFSRAELGLQQAIFAIEGNTFSIPDSTILLKVKTKMISIDACGNQTINIKSIAKDAFSTVILNSLDIFGRVPRSKGCKKILLHRVIWWKET
jgi:Tfp pilus assembly protein PilX